MPPPPGKISPTLASSKLYAGDVSSGTSIGNDCENVARATIGKGNAGNCGGGTQSLGSECQQTSTETRQQHCCQHHCHGDAKPGHPSIKGLNLLTGGGASQAPSSPRSTKMGNGASSNAHFTIDGECLDVHKVKVLVPELKHEIKRRDKIIEQYDAQVRQRDILIKEKDSEIGRLKEEVHKLKSVLQLKVDTLKVQETKPDLLSTIDENQAEPSVNKGPAKKQGVSGESSSSKTLGYVDLTHHEKDFK